MLRFSIRTMLVAMVAVSVMLGWIVSQTRRAIQQQRIVNQVRQLGGNVTYEYQQKNQPAPRPPALIQKLTGAVILSDVRKVTWQATRAQESDLVMIGRLTKLEDLRLNSEKLTDQTIAQFTDLQHLRRLDLWCMQVTNKSMPHIGRLVELRRLDLYGTQVSDDGLKSLYGLRNLKELKLRDTRVTPAGAAALEAAIPGCKVSGVTGWRSR